MPALQLGYKASAEQFPPRRLLDLAVAAERAGFDSVWTSDHFQPWRHTDGHAPNAIAWLGAATQATTRVILGTSVLTPSFRYNPAMVAQAFATLGCLAPGRVILGVGTGESMNEVPVGVDWPEQSERFARLRESVQLIQALSAPGAEFVDFEGQYYRTHEATIYDKPDQPVPIYIAASGPAAARLAGRLADGFICTSGKGAELYTDTLLPALAEGAEKAGRDASAMDRMIEMKVSFDTDLGRAMEDTKVWAALALTRRAEDGHPRPARDGDRGQGGRAVRAPALAGGHRPGRARRADRAVPRVRVEPPRVPLPGPGPGGGDRPLRRGHPAAPAGEVRLDDGHGSLPDARGAARPGAAAGASRPAPRRTRSPSACGSWTGRPSARSR